MNSDLHENRSEQEVIGKLSTLDRYLPLWIVIAMALGLILGRVIPSLQNALDSVKIDGTSLLIAIGLFAMMYPVLARVKYEEMGHLTGDRKMLWLSLILNWGSWSAIHVCTGVDFPCRPASVSNRVDCHWFGQMYRYGADLERLSMWGPRGWSPARRH